MKIFGFMRVYLVVVTLLVSLGAASSHRLPRRARQSRDEGNFSQFGSEINLETIDGVEQVTKLVLIKTDSLPVESDERIDGRYLGSLMETLYTGLRKPFKSVSADILGIFPSFEEVQVRCQDSSVSRRKIDPVTIKRSLQVVAGDNTQDQKNGNLLPEPYFNYNEQSGSKPSLQVCQAVTSDCLSMEELIDMLPPTIVTFDKALVRLCPVMLFRIMNNICHRSLTSQSQDKLISAYRAGTSSDSSNTSVDTIQKNSITLNNLLRETQILRSLKSSEDLGSKKPQKLHKKLKTQFSYKSNGRLNVESLGRQGRVDEELMRIRLKLTEPSIEKVWIFSLLFVVLSIVVSMGGLIVLPFVKKTTRRRILTLFEGLAVGGLSGSATLHMFPQAFGLVDENYHKYFWRIFVVFLGIYLCYLCERIIKILKVVRAKIKRRSCASLIDLNFNYNFPSVDSEFSRERNRVARDDFTYSSTIPNSSRKRSIRKSISRDYEHEETCFECIEARLSSKSRTKGDNLSHSIRTIDSSKNNLGTYRNDESQHATGQSSGSIRSTSPGDQRSNEPSWIQSYATRQRLIQCLRSVQSQFSPVYVVQDLENVNMTAKEAERPVRFQSILDSRDNPKEKIKLGKGVTARFNRAGKMRFSRVFRIIIGGKNSSARKYQKQREVETRLYHQHLSSRINRGHLDHDDLGQNLSPDDDVAAKRQDQDNAARMSVDTVAWMIVFGDAVLNVIDGLSIGAAFERNILAGISISVAVMLEEVTHRLGTFAVLIRAGMSMQQSLLCTFLSACALFPGLIVGILLSDATEDATPYIFCAAGGIFLYMVG